MSVKLFRIERWIAPLVRVACGRRVLRQGLRHAVRIYPGDDRHSMLRRCRFLVRTAWYRTTSATWFAFIDGSVWRRHQARLDPGLAELLHRPYRRSDLTAPQRLSAAVAHWQALEKMPWAPAAMSFLEQPTALAALHCKDGVDRQLILAGSGRFGKEGSCCLHLQCGADTVFSLAFSMTTVSCGDGPRLVLDVGCLQGPASGGKDLVRQTTKALHGVRPRELLLMGLRAVAAASGAQGLVGVGNDRHVYRHWRKRRRVRFDYDSYWTERGGRKNAEGDFELSLHEKEVSVEEVDSRKRAEFKRRQRLLAAMSADIIATLRPKAGLTAPAMPSWWTRERIATKDSTTVVRNADVASHGELFGR